MQPRDYNTYAKDGELMGDLNNRLTSLRNRHHELDKLLEDLEKKWVSNYEITDLKKEKLMIKEEITRVEREIEANIGF